MFGMCNALPISDDWAHFCFSLSFFYVPRPKKRKNRIKWNVLSQKLKHVHVSTTFSCSSGYRFMAWSYFAKLILFFISSLPQLKHSPTLKSFIYEIHLKWFIGQRCMAATRDEQNANVTDQLTKWKKKRKFVSNICSNENEFWKSWQVALYLLMNRFPTNKDNFFASLLRWQRFNPHTQKRNLNEKS